jgi:hypothetical protein
MVMAQIIPPASKQGEQPLSLNRAHFNGTFSQVMETEFSERVDHSFEALEPVLDEFHAGADEGRGARDGRLLRPFVVERIRAQAGIELKRGGLRLRRLIGAALVGFIWSCPPVAASEPLYVKNLSPVAGLSGLPSQRDAHTTSNGTFAVALHSSVANHYVKDNDVDEFLNLDGETLRFALELRYGVADNWDLQLEVPWLKHSSGSLDGMINDWHDFWGLPDGGRSNVRRNLLDYQYAGSQAGFGLQDDASGVGDISLSLSHVFYHDKDTAASLALGYKFGTGDGADFTGSGADDVFLALRFSGADLSGLPLSWHGQVGYLRAGSSDLLGDYQERNLWFAGLALDWQVAQNWSVIGQFDTHAAPMDSAISAVGGAAFLATLGARWRFARDWIVDVSFTEDIRAETAPDVTFQASLRYRSKRKD